MQSCSGAKKARTIFASISTDDEFGTVPTKLLRANQKVVSDIDIDTEVVVGYAECIALSDSNQSINHVIAQDVEMVKDENWFAIIFAYIWLF